MSEIHKMELFISKLMRLSVLVSGLLIATGVVLFLTSGNASCPADMFDPAWIINGNPFLEPSHVIFLGFMILVGTPMLRIVASIMVYIVQKDWYFTTITGLVFLVLAVSMLLGVG